MTCHSFSIPVRTARPRSIFALRYWFALFAISSVLSIAQDDGIAPIPDTEEKEPFRILLIQGGANHDFTSRGEILRSGIEKRIKRAINWTVIGDLSGRSDADISELKKPEWGWEFDLILHDHCYSRVSDLATIERILEPHQNGIPALLLHASVWSFPEKSGGEGDWERFTGARLKGETLVARLELSRKQSGSSFSWVAPAFWPEDEVYLIDQLNAESEIFLNGKGDRTAALVPLAWTKTFGEAEAKVFVTTLGNRVSSLELPEMLDLLSRGVLWALDQEGEWMHPNEEKILGDLENPDSLATLRLGSGVERSGTASAFSEDVKGGRGAGRAIDGDISTYWESASAGPTFWSLRLPKKQPIECIALAGKGSDLPDMKLELRRDSGEWGEAPNPDPYVESLGKGVRLWRFSEAGDYSEVRITFPDSRPGQRHGLREVVVYSSRSEIPSAFVAGNSAFAGDGLQMLVQSGIDSQIRTRAGWSWQTAPGLPVSLPPQDWFESATGDMFVISDPDDTDAPAISILHKKEGDLRWSSFLERLPTSGRAAAFWDGEWLSLVQSGKITRYRDSNRDGTADEKQEAGRINIREGATLLRIRLGLDGWCYGLLAQPGGDLPHQLIRFSRTGGDLEVLFSSKKQIKTYWLGSPGKLWLQVEGVANANPFRLLPLHAPAVEGDFSSSDFDQGAGAGSKSAGFFHKGQDIICFGEEAVSEREGSLTGRVAKVPNLFGVETNGSRALALHSDRESFQISILSPVSAERVVVDLDEVPNGELPGHLDSPSPQVRLETVYELFRRKKDLTKAVVRESRSFSQDGQIARLGYLSQLSNDSALGYLASATKTDQARVAFALLETLSSSKNLDVYRQILEIENPEVTAQILATLYRTGSKWKELEPLVYDWTKHASPLLAGTATSYILMNDDSVPVWEDFFYGASPDHALSIIPYLPAEQSIQRLLDAIDESRDPDFQQKGLAVLSRLYQDGRAGKWEEEIEEFFRAALQTKRFASDFLVSEMIQSGMNPGSISFLMDLAQEESSFESFVVGELESLDEIPSEADTWLTGIRDHKSKDSLLRLRAYRLLLRDSAEKEKGIYDFIIPLMNEVASSGMVSELLELWFETFQEELGLNVFSEIALASRSIERREFFWRALWSRMGCSEVNADEKLRLAEIFDRRLSNDPGSSFELAKIILGVKGVPEKVMEVGTAGNDESMPPLGNQPDQLRTKLNYAIGIRLGTADSDSGTRIKNMKELLSRMEKVNPDTSKGWEVFQSSRCADCHNIHREGPIVGPNIVNAAADMTIEEFAGVFAKGIDGKKDHYRAYELELRSGKEVTGWMVGEKEGRLRMLDVAGNPFEIPIDEIHYNRGNVGPQMALKDGKNWSAEDLASLREFLRSLTL